MTGSGHEMVQGYSTPSHRANAALTSDVTTAIASAFSGVVSDASSLAAIVLVPVVAILGIALLPKLVKWAILKIF